MRTFYHKKRGFTLIELMLYVGIVFILLSSVSFFMASFIESRIKNQVILEVESQGVRAMEYITQNIRDASSVNSPSAGATASTLSLGQYSAPINPTVFDVASGILQVSEGGGGAVELTNSRVTVSNISFYNVSRAGTPGIIQVQFTITYNNTLGRNEYDYSKTFISTATLRQP